MREILFRAKANSEIRDGEWVYGSLLAESENTFPIIARSYDNDEDWLGIDLWDTVEPQTVGQYIGVEDKNGKKVFEGDVLRYTPRPKCTIYYKVIWNQEWSRFALMQWSTHKYHLYEWAQHETIKYCCEVIGNIHDNPDLLELLESN